MAERSYIRRDEKLAVGWFTNNMMSTDLPEQHMAQFNSVVYPPVMNLTTEYSIESLATEINIFFENHDN